MYSALISHVSTNLIVDIDKDDDTATARSYFVVFQATEKLPFQAIVGGRYEDRFASADREWCFAERLIQVDQIGDMSEHLSFDLARGGIRYQEVVPPRS